MHADWVHSQALQLATGYLTDPRPAWLWLDDGDILLWHNPAAEAFKLKYKRKANGSLKPIGRQINRAIRLGSIGRASLSRLQFTIGKKPTSATCTCTPVVLANGELGLLVIGVDPVDSEALSPLETRAPDLTGLVPENARYVVVSTDGSILAGSEASRQIYDDYCDSGGENFDWQTTALNAGPTGTRVLIFWQDAGVPEQPEESVIEPTPEPVFDAGEVAAAEAAAEIIALESPQPAAPQNGTSLVDRLAQHEELFAPLGDADDHFEPTTPIEEPTAPVTDAEHFATDSLSDKNHAEPSFIVFEDDEEDEGTQQTQLWRVIGQGFEADTDELAPEEEGMLDASDEVGERATFDHEEEERVARYNFEELSRILSDRISAEPTSPSEPPKEIARTSTGSLVNLSDENLILNRLSLGLLVFRDQQVLFTNRALTEMLGYNDTASLREAGLSAIFPDTDATEPSVGPVSCLVGKFGQRVNVSARLQSIIWQGRPALLLSAAHSEKVADSEVIARNFAEMLADAQDDGFFETNRAGIISSVSERTAQICHRSAQIMMGRPVLSLVALKESARLKAFLEQPARFAGAERPFIRLAGADAGYDVLIFASGMAGIVSGYFGLVHRLEGQTVTPQNGDKDTDAELLERISRSIRRPLNTIVGFSELIQSGAFGMVQLDKHLEYAQDINTAGQEISALVDELEQYARLRGGDYDTNPAEFDLGLLLDQVVARIRQHASRARVLVRSAISDDLPRISADRATLEQALLNLLASAVDQTPEGAQVVLSAHQVADGSIEVHVRDSSLLALDGLEERFVVFRDGTNHKGELLRPVRSSVGLALTRTLLAVNACSLSMDPTAGVGMLMSLVIPADLVARPIA